MSPLSALLALALLTGAPAPQQDALARARALYNQQQYEAAIAAAQEAQRRPATADAGALVLARAYLERFRAGVGQTSDLAAARDALAAVNPARLAPADRDALLVGLGEALYFDDRFGAAASLFDGALAHVAAADVEEHDRLLDWWAASVDRDAQLATDAERRAAYAEMLDRMTDELRLRPDSAVASYWVVAAARGVDDPDLAWSLAIASWVRAPLCGGPDAAAGLRTDLDRLVQQAIIPERARHLVPSDEQRAIDLFRVQWATIKQQWK